MPICRGNSSETSATVSRLPATVRSVVKIDVEAVGAMLDELLADPVRSPLEELEPDYEFLEPSTHCTCSCH
jgi:hypothetical protein